MPDLPVKNDLPTTPFDRFIAPIERFMHVEAASGIVLLLCTAVALILANSPWAQAYHHFWETKIGFAIGQFQLELSLHHWVNDGLMAIFFFVIGLEVKREIVMGELRDMRRAALPLFAALGGMLAPAGIYLLIEAGKPGAHGWGIPMATDIAFVVGCMAILGPRVPRGLRIMVLTLAIADDIGAILVIAFGYTDEIHTTALLLGFAGFAVVYIMMRLGVRSFVLYAIVAAMTWYFFHESGVHATIAGVIIGLLTPTSKFVNESVFMRILDRARQVFEGGGFESLPARAQKLRRLQYAVRETIPPTEYLENALHPWVGFVIMPVFALANAGVEFSMHELSNSIAIAVIVGLVIGKPVGVTLLSWIAVRLKIAALPTGVGWAAMVGAGMLAGIGFTMALFIAGLAMTPETLPVAKVGVLSASGIAAVVGMIMLWIVLPKPKSEQN